MRVALRRLRAAFRLFKSVLPEDQYGWAVAEAKWLTVELSAARAWDVFADEFVAPVARLYGEDQGFDALMAAVEQARQQGRQRARDAIGTERYTEFLLHLSAWLSSQAWRDQPVTERTTRLLDPIDDHCVKLLQKRDRNVRRQGRDIANLSETALHELRLAVKRLRYAVDFFESLYPKKQAKAYRKHLAGLQDGLGYLNDVAAADTLLRELALTGGDQAAPVWAHAGGLTVGWHRHAAIAAKDRLVKDYTNGLQDAANMLATIVASRATTPIQAAILVSFFTFLGPILGGTAVANTIGNFVDVTDLETVASLTIVLAGLIGAIAWNLITWWFGLPASSSQALVGGLVGAVVVAAGPEHVVWGFAAAATGQLSGVTKVLGALLISPILGFLFGWVTHRIMRGQCRILCAFLGYPSQCNGDHPRHARGRLEDC